ncbi:TPA: hypothetical protein ACK3JR_001540 [Mannheimia haemolytica]
MNLNTAVDEIEKLWASLGKSTYPLKSNSKLWHSGIIDFGNTELSQDRVVWLTRDFSKSDYYNAWAKDEAKCRSISAYKLELSCVNNLNLAEFNEHHHFHEITKRYLDSQHTNLNKALNQFCIRNSIDGIIRGDNLNEVAILATNFQNLKLLAKVTL